MAIAELKSSLAAFATFARSLKGDEKSEAQSFLDHFFRALGHPSAIAAVRAAYAMPKDADPLVFLLALNLTLASKEIAGEPITPPGLPLPERDRAAFLTTDCIEIRRSNP